MPDPTAIAIEPVTEPAADPAPATDPVITPDPDVSPEPPQHWSRSESLSLDDDTIGWLENKGFDSPQAMVTSQRELERKMGGPPEMLQKWPESDDKDGFDAIYRRLGTPEDVEGYKFEFEEGANVDEGTLGWFKGVALEQNMPNSMAQGMILGWNAEVARLQEEQQQAIDVQNQTEETELRNSWGTKYDERLDYGHRALVALGLSEDHIDSLQGSLGIKMVAEFAAKIADTMGEDTIAEATNTTAFGVSKQQVQTQIDELYRELKADTKRFERFRADHSAPKESTDKDYRRMEQLDAQLKGLINAGG